MQGSKVNHATVNQTDKLMKGSRDKRMMLSENADCTPAIIVIDGIVAPQRHFWESNVWRHDSR